MAPKIDLTGLPQKIVNVPAGKPINLHIPIKGRPLPVCSWFYGGAKMKDSLDRVKIETTGKYTRLIVRETTIDDTGDYTLEVKNVTGTAREVIKVVILGKCFCLCICVCVFVSHSQTSVRQVLVPLIFTFQSRQTWNTCWTCEN